MEVHQVFSMYSGERQPGAGFRYCPRCATELARATEAERAACRRCGYVDYRNPLPGVVVLVADGPRVLLGKRSDRSFQGGKWALPGGFIEYEEDFLSAALRESREETNLEVRIVSILSVVSNFLAPGLHTLVVVLLAEACGGEAHAGDDFVELAWYEHPGPLPPMAFPADTHIIERYFRDRSGGPLPGAPVDQRFSSSDPSGLGFLR